jgi:predicted nuclease of restriction endonuclease-like (RecB) superfamily
MSTNDLVLPEGYDVFLHDLQERIQRAQVRAAVAVNSALVLLYWEIGREILRQQATQGWGARVIDRLSADLRRAFPEMQGFSTRNLKYMRAFAEAYPAEAIVQQAAAQIPWFHNCVVLDKSKSNDERIWYIQQTREHGWSRAILVHQIEGGQYRRQGRAVTNFASTLPAPQSDLARQLLKDPYNFDFLGLGEAAHERGLIEHIRAFLLEVGVGFAFVGSQYHLAVGDQDFYLDLLFYHLRLRCYVVIELKVGRFKPEDAGKLNFYLSAVDDLLRHPGDQPSVGLILCKGQEQVIVEYALRDTQKPIGVAEYQLMQVLPEHFKGSLPTIAELEETLSGL